MSRTVQIGKYTVGEGHPCFIVAEIGIWISATWFGAGVTMERAEEPNATGRANPRYTPSSGFISSAGT